MVRWAWPARTGALRGVRNNILVQFSRSFSQQDPRHAVDKNPRPPPQLAQLSWAQDAALECATDAPSDLRWNGLALCDFTALLFRLGAAASLHRLEAYAFAQYLFLCTHLVAPRDAVKRVGDVFELAGADVVATFQVVNIARNQKALPPADWIEFISRRAKWVNVDFQELLYKLVDVAGRRVDAKSHRALWYAVGASRKDGVFPPRYV